MKRHLVTSLYLCLTLATFAQETKIPKELDNLSVKYAEATAYFDIVIEALGKSGKENTKYAAVRDDAMLYSLLLASEGRTQDVAVKVTHARIEVSKKDMLREMNYRNENIAIIENKYAEVSLDLMKNPPEELQELIAKYAKMPAPGGKNAATEELKKK